MESQKEDTPGLLQRMVAGLAEAEGVPEVKEAVQDAGHVLHPPEGPGQDLHLLATQDPESRTPTFPGRMASSTPGRGRDEATSSLQLNS